MSLQAMLWASNLEIPSTRKLVLMIMGDHANTKNECWPSRSKLARRCSLSVGTIDRCIEDAETWGLIEKELRQHESGKKRSNKYTLRLDRAAPPDAMDGSGVEPTPDDEDESDDETTTSGRDAEGRLHGDSMGRSHCDAMDGVTAEPANRTTHLEPSPLNPPKPSPAASAASPNASVSASGKAQGSAGQENTAPDVNSLEFIRGQFEQLITFWQQAGWIKFAGDTEAGFPHFRKLPFERRVEDVTKAPNYIKGKKAEYAQWHDAPRRERAKAPPKPATIKDYVGLHLSQFVGIPSEPPSPPKPVNPTWCEVIRRGSRSQFDHDAVFVAHDSEAFTDWIRAERRAGVTAQGARPFVKRDLGQEHQPVIWRGHGRYFASEYPPREEEFEDGRNAGQAETEGQTLARKENAA